MSDCRYLWNRRTRDELLRSLDYYHQAVAIEPGATPAADVTLRWWTFDEAADEAGMSRRYGGIHFQRGDVESRQIGRAIGSQTWHTARKYFRSSSEGR